MARPSLVLLLLVFFAFFSAYADVFQSINCGSADFYTDENSIVWMGDDTLIQNGESEIVQANNNGAISHVLTTLRVFKSRKKNCYSIRADKGGQVLVRASFFYGNYDKKSSPPSFDLHFDGNYWVTVQTSLDQPLIYEVAYVVKNDYISVCVAQTHPNQFPFISALEIRSLDSNTYSGVDSTLALHLTSRIAYGSNATIRFPDDGYDRIWVPARIGNGLTTITSDSIIINTDINDNPPQPVLQNAITTSATSNKIVLGTNLPANEVPIYINMYFSEVRQLETTELRSFQIYIDNKVLNADPVLPPYEEVSETVISNTTASFNTSFSLVSTTDSTLPPLINAMEVFYLTGPLTDGTNTNDVDGLGALQTAFSTIQDWSGDPCLPSPYIWDWLNCSDGPIPRITALYLNGYDLSGPLPDFSSMDALEIIDLHNNSINGPIPDFLGNFPNLKQLNLANNALSGPIPTSITKNTKLKLVVTGNPNLCVSGKSCQTTTTSSATSSSGGKKSSKLPVILGSTIPTFIVFWLIVGVLIVLHQKRKRAAIAATTQGHGGGKGTNGATNNSVLEKISERVMNDIKVSIEDQINTEINDQIQQQQQQQ